MIESIVKRSAGLDVHKKIIVATVEIENPDGHIKSETKEFGTFLDDSKLLAKWLKGKKIELVVMESTGVYWKSLYSILEEKGIKMFVVNARHVKKVPGRKTDVKDSQWLATLARYGLLKSSFIPQKDLRELRQIGRYRTKIVQMLASEKNRIHKLLDDAGIKLGNVVSDINGVSAQSIIEGLIEGKPMKELVNNIRGSLKSKIPDIKRSVKGTLSNRHRFLLKKVINHIRYLEDEIQDTERYIFEAMEPYRNQWEILQTIPGVSAISAALIIIELGIDMKAFGSQKQLCSWAGVCPGNNESAGKRKSGRTRKGNNQLRFILCEIANAALKTDSQFKSKYKSLVIRRGHKKAVIAIGHKMLRVIHSSLSNNEHYRDPKVNYEELMVRKNAPRWIRNLEKFGYLQETNYSRLIN